MEHERVIRRTGRPCRLVLPNPPCAEIPVAGVLVVAASFLVEEVVRSIRDKRCLAHVSQRCTARRGCESSARAQPLDKAGIGQAVAAGRSVLNPRRCQLEPGS